MPTNPNMVAIQTVTVGAGGSSSISFTSIPQTYTDLQIILSARTDGASPPGYATLRFNGNSSAIYSRKTLQGDGNTAQSYPATGETAVNYIYVNGNAGTASTFSNTSIYIPNYNSSNNKALYFDTVQEYNETTNAWIMLQANLWANTSAITSITLEPQNVDSQTKFLQHSTATLYGITSAGSGAKATGGVITSDANYYYHTFVSSGTFTPTQSLTADYLVVAGGGGGGPAFGGGGGGGGLRCTVGATGGGGSLPSALSLTAQAYTVTIGGGGAGGAWSGNSPSTTKGSNGSNSVFSSITSTGGGGGGVGDGGYGSAIRTGNSGGSGGGSAYGIGSGGAGTSNEGYAGGTGSALAPNYNSGGGGGAGAVGATATLTQQGNGGNGVQTSISGTATYYAGGGGGGGGGNGSGGNSSTGGLGGGGNGTLTNSPNSNAGTTNTGGGGSGGNGFLEGLSGGAGGSGIVIIRYAK